MKRSEPTVVVVFGVQPLRIGGIERFTRELARQLECKNARLTAIFAGPAKGSVEEFLRAKNLTIISAPGLDQDLRTCLPVILRTVQQIRPQVFHFHFLPFLGPLPWLARLSGAKQVIFTAHGSNPPGLHEARRAPLAGTHCRANHMNAPLSVIICVSVEMEHPRRALVLRGICCPLNGFARFITA